MSAFPLELINLTAIHKIILFSERTEKSTNGERKHTGRVLRRLSCRGGTPRVYARGTPVRSGVDPGPLAFT